MKLAARIEDVGEVLAWSATVPIPSRTPFVQAMLKRDNDVMPVYDLAARLRRLVQGNPLLCLVARHLDGPMAICIDADVPAISRVDAVSIRQNGERDIESLGSVTIGENDVTIVALQRLGSAIQNTLTRYEL